MPAMLKTLDIAFGILRLEPFGGLERHAVRLAEALTRRGHSVTVYTTSGLSNLPSGIHGMAIRPRGITNHTRLAHFARAFARAARGRHDTLVGFQKMPGLDVLFCADSCYAARPLGPLLARLPRAVAMRALEASCFGPSVPTRIILLAENQRAAYQGIYGTPLERTAVLPPTADPRRRRQTRMSETERKGFRERLDLPADRTLWLWVGLQPRVKGLDRVIAALADQDAVVAVCGAGPGAPSLARMLRGAASAGYRHRVHVLGRVDDATLAGLLEAADLLIHPARIEVTGTVIVEALESGLPVITTAVCGYAAHVVAADAGVVLPESFDPAALRAAITAATSERRRRWSDNALAYVARSDVSGGIERAADLIEAAGGQFPSPAS